jgi:glutamate racemase
MENNIKTPFDSVCVFDSGIGGLNVLYECARQINNYNFCYFADNYNVPYGNLPVQEIKRLTFAIFDKINDCNPAAAVVACNTVTATCIDELRAKYTFPIVGIQPAVKPAAKHGGKCLVLATKATLASASFNKLLTTSGICQPIICPCEELADYIEKNIMCLPENLPQGLLPDMSADCVVLGCTHYAFVKNNIAKKYCCPIFDGISGTADHLKKILGKTGHFLQNEQEIIFCGGNFRKNSKIFDKLNN